MNMATNIPYKKSTQLIITLLIVLCCVFSLLPAGFNWSTLNPQGSYTEGSYILQIQFGSIFVIGAWLAWRNKNTSLANVRSMNLLLLLLVLYCLLTVIWSPYPTVTLKRVTQLVGLIIVAIAIAPPIGRAQQLISTMLATFTGLILLSIVVVLTVPSIGIDAQLNHAWRGIFPQKNGLGAVAALSTIFWIQQMYVKRLPLIICILGGLMSLFILIMTKSTTALLVCMFCAGLYIWIRKRHLADYFATTRLILIGIIFLSACLILFYMFESRLPTWSEIFYPIHYFSNKSSDLTGRTDIWQLVLLEINLHPWQGIGYGAFWLGEGSPSQYIIDVLHWIPLQSHNGYVDILNELGIIGLALFTGTCIWHTVNLVRLLKLDREETAIHSVLFVYILLSNVSESELFRGISFQNILFIFSSISVSSQLALHRIAKKNLAKTEQIQQ
jgi:exopolysaccharide production protein ExoQ